MKKRLIFVLFVLGLFSFISCNKKEVKNDINKIETEEEIQVEDTSYEVEKAEGTKIGADKIVSTGVLKEFFNLDYAPQSLEEEIEETRTKKTYEAKSTGKETTSVIPSIKNFSEYSIKYSEEKKVIKEKEKKEPFTEELENDESVEFVIEDWGPKKIVASNKDPSLYVIFSKPVIPLSEIGVVQTESEVMKIEPPLKGVYRWYGTDHLAFEISDFEYDVNVEYTITVNEGVKSIFGEELKGERTFVTEKTRLEMVELFPGYKKNEAYRYEKYIADESVKCFYIKTNRMASVEEIKNSLDVRKSVLWNTLEKKRYNKTNVENPTDVALKFNVEPDYTNPFPYWHGGTHADIKREKTDSFIITIEDEIERHSVVRVKLNSNFPEEFYTLHPFDIYRFPEKTKFSSDDQKNPFRLNFTNPVDVETIIDNITFDFDYKLTKDNYKVEGYSVLIYNLPIQAGDVFTIRISENLKDIYGQKLLVEGAKEGKIKVPLGIGYAKYLDGGIKMLEAQYGSKFLYEHQNLLAGSYYEIGNVKNPLSDPNKTEVFLQSLENKNHVDIEDVEKDQRKFEEIDLNPYLKNGYGFIGFQSKSNYQRVNYWDEIEKRTTENRLILQVTDIGITARIGINKVVLMVRSLATGKPIKDAVVKIQHLPRFILGDPEDLEISKTDENGFCVVYFSEETINKIIEQRAYNYYYNRELVKELIVRVENGDDAAVFKPDSHNPWRHDVNTIGFTRILNVSPKTFAFVDRGVYKPGETVTFRGVDRNKYLGTYEPVTGPYVIKVAANWWNGPTIIEEINGELSESGGFYGSFKIPEDCSTGPYVIKYARIEDGKKTEFRNIHSFIVAEFERVKFESKIEIPNLDYQGGQSINSSFSANYLGGGSISGGDYHSKWYRQRTDFRPKTKETKGYIFRYKDFYSRSYDFISENFGTLDAKGSGVDSCKTEKITNGQPYLYKNEVSITDVSNQKISASTSVMVHPASFYIGLKRARNVVGYAKKGTTLEIPYILVDVHGNKLSSLDEVKSLEYSIFKEEWVMVHEQGVNGEVYSKYEKQKKDESSGSVKIEKEGILKITPNESGWYTLTLTGKDNSDNFAKSTLEFYITGGKSFWYNQNDSCGINLTPDKAEYLPGETAQILLESPLDSGDYLVTVEREGIFVEEIVHFDSPSNVIDIKIDSKFVPVVYVSVSSYSMRKGPPTHEYGEVDLDKPKGYYGVTKLFVNPNVRSFTIDIDLEKEAYKPGEEVTIDLETTKNGKPLSGVELTVMAVDRGILDLIDYHVPNPIEFFYDTDNFPLGVYGGDSRALLMDPVTYSIESLKGGDADEEKEDERKDFRPTAVFEPVVITDENGRAKVTFTMPDSLTTYRITAFGVKKDLFSLKESEVTVQNPINVQQVQPRKLRERDTAECGVLISNLDKNGHDITVEFEVRTPEGNTFEDEREGRKTVPGKAIIEGESKQTVYVNPGDSTVVYFNIGAIEKGTVELVYKINSDILNEKLISTIKIEKSYVYETVTSMNSLSEKEKKGVELIEIPTNIEDTRGDLTFTMDATRLGLLGGAVNYVFDYPYGCLEQQSAKILPLIIFEDYIDVFDINSEISDVRKCVTTFTQEWGRNQLSNGGFPYWPGEKKVDSYFVSLRIAHIYALAIKKGYTSEELGINISKLKRYIRDNKQYSKAYYCYVSSLLGDSSSSVYITREELYENKKFLSFEELAYIGLSYYLEGNEKYIEIADFLRNYLVPSERSVSLLERNVNRYSWSSSEAKDMALILQLLVCNNPDDIMVDKLLFTLLQKQRSGYWKNTATTATVLQAICTYIEKLNLAETNYDGKITFGKKEIFNQHFEGLSEKPKTLVLPFEGDIISSVNKNKAIKVEFEKAGKGRLFYTTEMKYALKEENYAARDNGISVQYIITDAKTGKVINKPDNSSCKIVLESGKDYNVKAVLISGRDRDYVALRCPIPSGAEIIDSTFVTSQSDAQEIGNEWIYISNKDVRDNEIQFFWNNYRGLKEVRFTFRAVRRGIYPLPPAMAECMYEPEVFGRSDGYLCVIQ